jgi:hypothetical protein
MAATESSVTRRELLRLGTLTVVGAAALAGFGVKPSYASGPTYCNSNRPTTPSDALTALLGDINDPVGNYAWVQGGTTPPGLDTSRRDCVAEQGRAQTPYAAILSCVDSRVPPEDVFYAGVGDLFVARVAGNSVVPILQDSLRYGTDNLGALVLFVLGHSNCGAVSAAVSYYLKHFAHSSAEFSVPEVFSPHFHVPDPDFAFIPPILPAVKVARKIVRKAGGNPDDPSQVVPVATNQHVILTVEYLSSQEPFRRLIRDNKLIVTGGVYNLVSYLVNSPPPAGYPGTLS